MDSLATYLVIVAVAAVLAWYDLRFFALYAFAVPVGLIFYLGGRLWKLVSVSHAATNVKIQAIAKKVGVSDTDFDRVIAKEKAERPKEWKDFERDARNL